jgi:hypothetical protein
MSAACNICEKYNFYIAKMHFTVLCLGLGGMHKVIVLTNNLAGKLCIVLHLLFFTTLVKPSYHQITLKLILIQVTRMLMRTSP